MAPSWVANAPSTRSITAALTSGRAASWISTRTGRAGGGERFEPVAHGILPRDAPFDRRRKIEPGDGLLVLLALTGTNNHLNARNSAMNQESFERRADQRTTG